MYAIDLGLLFSYFGIHLVWHPYNIMLKLVGYILVLVANTIDCDAILIEYVHRNNNCGVNYSAHIILP